MSARKRAKPAWTRVHISLPLLMREELETLVIADGRGLGEYVRALISQELKASREKIPPPPRGA